MTVDVKLSKDPAKEKPEFVRFLCDLRFVIRDGQPVLQARWQSPGLNAAFSLCPGPIGEWEDIRIELENIGSTSH